MLEQFGGYEGFERGIDPFHAVLAEVKASRGSIYRKAAIFLQRMIDVRIFQDGNHRTAFEVTDTFLRMNGEKIKITNEKETIALVKNIQQYSIGQIGGWLENGKML